MTKILHISTECYPAAKVGGMGDVVGALPIYLPQFGIKASVILPKYANKWFEQQQFKTLKKGSFKLGDETIKYQIQILENEDLGYPFYCVDIPGKFDRESPTKPNAISLSKPPFASGSQRANNSSTGYTATTI